jgi:hypothetical protein
MTPECPFAGNLEENNTKRTNKSGQLSSKPFNKTKPKTIFARWGTLNVAANDVSQLAKRRTERVQLQPLKRQRLVSKNQPK